MKIFLLLVVMAVPLGAQGRASGVPCSRVDSTASRASGQPCPKDTVATRPTSATQPSAVTRSSGTSGRTAQPTKNVPITKTETQKVSKIDTIRVPVQVPVHDTSFVHDTVTRWRTEYITKYDTTFVKVESHGFPWKRTIGALALAGAGVYLICANNHNCQSSGPDVTNNNVLINNGMKRVVLQMPLGHIRP